MRENHFVVVGIILSVLTIGIEVIIYKKLGFYLDCNSYDPIATREWVKITLSIFAMIWSIIAVLITQQTLKEQRKQIQSTNIQHFENTYHQLLQRQWEIRKDLLFKQEIIADSSIPQLITLKGERYFEGLYWFLFYLDEAYKQGCIINSQDKWEETVASFDDSQQYSVVDWHERPEWCEQNISNDLEKLKALYVSYVFAANMKDINSKLTAYKVIHSKFNIQHSLYFRHFKMIVLFLDNQVKLAEMQDNLNYYLFMLKANMTKYELLMLRYYSRCTTKIGDILESTNFFSGIDLVNGDCNTN